MARAGTLVLADDGGLVTGSGFAVLARLARYVRARAGGGEAPPGLPEEPVGRTA
jgi:hypothetical protein